MNCVILTVSFLSYTSKSLYLLTVSLYSFSSQASNMSSNSLTISCLSSSSWLWMLSLSPTRQSKILSLFLLSSSKTTMCWQHFCLVSEMMSRRLTQAGLLFSRKCCSVCSTMQLGHSGIRHSLSQQKLVRNSLEWQAQQILRISAVWESVVWLMRDMVVTQRLSVIIIIEYNQHHWGGNSINSIVCMVGSGPHLILIYIDMSSKRRVRVKKLQGTPYYISEDEKLGKGSYGEVYKAYSKDNPGEPLVAKIINLHESHNLHSIEAELQIIRELPNQENLVNCLKAHIASQNNLYIIMEYCNGGSLENYIEKMRLMPQEKIWDFLYQFCKGYQVLLDANLIHRDIKPDNILINDGIFKIADFGLSKRIQNPSLIENLSFKGSPLYMAPEIVDNKEGNSKIDVFSLGCVVYQLAYEGNQPFYSEDKKYRSMYDYFSSLKDSELTLRHKNKKGQLRSLELRELISKMLEKNHEKRISWEQIFSYKKININKVLKEKSHRPNSQKENELQFLRQSLIQVNKSSAKIEEFVERQNVREQSQSMTLQLIEFEEILKRQELKDIQRVVFRLKITFLTIFHSNHQISFIVKQNSRHQKLHKHIIDGLKKVAIEGLLYLLKGIDKINDKLTNYEESIVRTIKIILNDDKMKILEEYQKQLKIFKNIENQRANQAIKAYDLRSFQHCLYDLLTEYCDYPKELKDLLRKSISILIDIYDSALKLTELLQTEKIYWQKSDFQEIQTKMDQICLNRLEPQQFHSYLMGKEHVSEKDVNASLKRVGLLFQ